MKERPATEVDRAALETARKAGMEPVEVSLPDWPYDSLNLILFAEGAAAFEELTLSGGLRRARKLRFRMRGRTCSARRDSSRQLTSCRPIACGGRSRNEMARVFSEVDLLLVPSLRDEMLIITNFTGHPSLTMRAGFVEVQKARSDWAPGPGASLANLQHADAACRMG